MHTNKEYRQSDKKMVSYDDLVANARYIMDPAEARELLTQLGDKTVALDFETTGLDPRYSRVRLSCIFHPDHGAVILDHMFCGTFSELCHDMLGPVWLVYNAKFEAKWFDHFMHGTRVDMVDIDFLAKVKQGGHPSSLAKMAKRDLGVIMDKEEQLSDWSQERLSKSQLDYAALDPIMAYYIAQHWLEKLTQAQKDAVFTFQEAVLPTVECEDTGMVLDVDVHMANINKWKMKQALMLKRVRRWTSPAILANPNSDPQVSNLIKSQLDKKSLAMWPKTEKTQQLSLNRKVVQPIVAKAGYPFSRWMNALLRLRYYNKYLSTYGETLVTKQHLEDAVTFRLNIAQAATGRYSSSNINIQNIPRAPWVRRAFLPPRGFDEFTIADYSGIEIRVLAELSGDKKLLEDAVYGNVHAGSASAIYKIDEDEFLAVIDEVVKEGMQHSQNYYKYKELRSIAKGFTFQNIYGAAAAALSVVLKCSVAEAEEALRNWAARYPKAYNYRYIMFEKMMNGGYLPVCDGRTIFVNRMDRSIPVAANYGVQGAAASVMYRAMHHVYQLRNARSNRHLIRLAATVHDELVLANMREHREEAQTLLVEGMILGWLDIFPGTTTDNLVEAASGPNWGAAK